LTEYLIQTREPLLIKENVAAVLEELGIETIGQKALSWLGVPMIIGERVIGMIAAQSYTTPRLYDEHHRDLLIAIANQAAIAIENAHLFKQIQTRAERERTIREITDQMQQTMDMETLMRITAEELNRALGGSRVYVRLGTKAQLTNPKTQEAGRQDDAPKHTTRNL
jgi:GAF domain-containing protein